MEIENIAPGFAVSAQITPPDVAEIAARGFMAIVCNRPDGEVEGQLASSVIADEAARHGLAFAYIPIAPGGMTDGDAHELARFLNRINGPVLGYCGSGKRSTSLWERMDAIKPNAD